MTENELEQAMQENKDSIEKQKRQNKHWWMIDKEWIEEVDYNNKEYLIELLDHLFTFISTRPIPLLIKWDTNLNNRLWFNIGQYSKHYEIDPDIAPFDFTYRAEREFLQSFYPMYKVPVPGYREPSFDEIRDRIQQGMSFSQASSKIKEIRSEIGIIDTVYMGEQTFRFIIDGNKTIRMPGRFRGGNSLVITLKDFLYKLRKVQEKKIGKTPEECVEIDKEIKSIIENESEFSKTLDVERPITVDYTGRKMVNFIKIHLPELFKTIMQEEEDGYFSWGRYRIKFITKALKDECFDIISRYRSKQKMMERGE